MDWNIMIPLFSSIATGLISYLAAVNKSKTDIANSNIVARNEIDKIKESSNAELNRIKEQYNNDLIKLKAETDERIRVLMAEAELGKQSKSDDMVNSFAANFIQNPESIDVEKISEGFNGLLKLKEQMDKMQNK